MSQSELDNGELLESMKKPSSGGVSAWPTDEYMNIWVCDISFDGQLALLGYATPPNNLPNWNGGITTDSQYDGVVVHYSVFGRDVAPDVGGGQIVNFLGRELLMRRAIILGLDKFGAMDLADMKTVLMTLQMLLIAA